VGNHTNQNLNKAKWLKKDEFYTDMADIEFAMPYYKEWLKGRMVYLNCDDPTVSSFYKYFTRLDSMFEYQLKELAVTYFISQQADLFDDKPPLKPLITGITKDGLYVDRLKGDGSFDSPECLELLKRADVVITNPPFSLFRKYFGTLVKYNKKFVILGPLNAVCYRDIFPHFKDNKVWLGVGSASSKSFQIPEHYKEDVDVPNLKERDGKKYFSLGNVVWFTNLGDRPEIKPLKLSETYHPDKYPVYDNYPGIIEVPSVKDIPQDYEGKMGVPMNFLYNHNPSQFEIVGRSEIPKLNNKGLFRRIFIRRVAS